MIQSAVRNLVDNAVKFTSTITGSREALIEIGSYRGKGRLAGQIVYYVRDNGVGFDMRYVDKLFGVFQRLHAHDEFGGTGIGLATVRRIVERHGGNAWAEGELDKGATVSISLPENLRPESGARHETAASAFARLSTTSPGAIIDGVRKNQD